jgi:hypothetical protein
MAEATITRAAAPVLKVTLELSPLEARVVRALCGRIGGSSNVRGAASSVWLAMKEAGFTDNFGDLFVTDPAEPDLLISGKQVR